MKKTKRILTALLCVALVLSMGGGLILPAFCSTMEADTAVDLDKTDPLDDLDGCMIEGVGFSLQNWGFDKTKNTQVFNLLEYGYGYREKFKETLELYVYIYNPQNKVFLAGKPDDYLTGGSDDYSITMRIQGESDDEYIRYRMEYISFSQKEGFEFLFYKYKVVIPSSDMSLIWPSLNMPERVYEIGEVQLVDPFGKVIETLSGSKYVYTGYMAGCGVSDDSASTLQCKGSTSETLSLDVNFAYYRPSGTNGSTKYTQDSLHSCYFAVPKRYIEDYGEMVRVRAQWYDALLKPFLITGNYEAWDALQDYVLVDVSRASTDWGYAYVSDYDRLTLGGLMPYTHYDWHYRYNYFPTMNANDAYIGKEDIIVDSIYLLFSSAQRDELTGKWREDTADSWVVSGLDIQTKIENASLALAELGRGESLFSTGYNSELFESWDSAAKVTVIDKYNEDGSLKYESLTSVLTTQNLWQKFWGTSSETSTTYDDIQMIKEITDADFGENDSACAAALYVSEGDYAELKYFYEKNKNDSVIYLVRYQVSEYTAEEVGLYDKKGMVLVDTNACFAQMTVNVDFDIIDVTFRKDNIDTVIAVSMIPLTFIPDATPPVNTTSDASGWDELWQLLRIVLLLIVIIVVGVFVMPFVMPVLRVFWKGILVVLKVGWKVITFLPRTLWRLLTKK